MTFEWDENKNKINQQKHNGLSFEIAAKVFLDAKRIEHVDLRHSTLEEERYYTIGKVNEIIFVVYTERNDNKRIISARYATKEETDEYYKDYDIR